MSRQLNGTAGAQRRGEQVGQRDDDLVRVALVGLHVEEALGAGAAALVDDDDAAASIEVVLLPPRPG
jgi:hypothetical protein